MIEVFKTNVCFREDADRIVKMIGRRFAGCTANFDLDDCDRVLRVQSSGTIDGASVVRLLQSAGYHAEVLADVVPTLPFS